MIQKEKTKIDRYVIEGVIGKETQEKLVIKELQAPKTPREEQLIQSEKAILKKLKHPNIVRLVNDFEINKQSYMVLEYCSKGDLEKYLILETEDSRFTELQAKYIFRQVFDALVYLQQNNIMHRDLKPANILLTDHLTVKLADFGVSKQLENKDQTTRSFCGSPNLMAPEQLRNNKPYGIQCDVFSLGGILYYMLFGEYPQTTLLLQGVGFFRDPKPVSFNKVGVNASKEVIELIKGMLEEDTSKRITLKQIQDHPWMKNTQDDHLLCYKSLFTEHFKPLKIQFQLCQIICQTFKARLESNLISNYYQSQVIGTCIKAWEQQIELENQAFIESLVESFINEIKMPIFQITISIAKEQKQVIFEKCISQQGEFEFKFVDFEFCTYKFIDELYRQYLIAKDPKKARNLLQFISTLWSTLQRQSPNTNCLAINAESKEEEQLFINAIQGNQKFLETFYYHLRTLREQINMLQSPLNGVTLDWNKRNSPQTQQHLEQLAKMLEFRIAFFL